MPNVNRKMSPWLTYGLAVVATVVAALLRLVLAPVLDDAAPFVTYFAASLFVGWFGGFRPAVLNIILSAVTGTYLLISPTPAPPFSFSTRADLVTVVSFVLVGLAVNFLLDLQRRTLERKEEEAVLRRTAEHAEREQRQWFETTLASIGDAVVATDAEGKVIFMNGVASELMGWGIAEARGLPLNAVFRIFNEITGAEAANPIDKVIQEGVTVGLANHTVLISKDGRRIPLDDSGAPIKRDGNTLGAVLVFRDVSERRRGERDAAYLAAIVESSDDAIVGKSADGLIQSWNVGAEHLYGYQAAEMIGHNIAELVPSDHPHEEAEILARLHRGERVEHFETVRLRKGGELIDVSLTISPIRDRVGRIIGASHVARDIRQQKKSAAQMRQTQKLESLGVLASGIAHDFNNLLVSVLGNAGLALMELRPESPARGTVQSIEAAAFRAAELTKQLLAYSGKGKFLIQPLNLSQLVEEMVHLLKISIPKKATLRTRLHDELPAVEGDMAQIQQVVMNLITNAAEALGDQAGDIVVSTGVIDADRAYFSDAFLVDGQPEGRYVFLEVTDTGYGMDKETQSRIFDPFFTTKFAGRGLGLAAVMGIIRGHRGAIKLYSEPGHGTAFKVFFPSTQQAVPTVKSSMESMAWRGTGTILVVDDEEGVREVAGNVLEKGGFTVMRARDGQTGVEMFRTHAGEIRAVLLDLTMPDLSGEEVFRAIRAIQPNAKIVITSGYSEQETISLFQGKGLAGFIQKPFKAYDLIEKVREILAQTDPLGQTQGSA